MIETMMFDSINTIELLTDVLLAHFANGCRLNSPIELVRLRSFIAKEFGVKIMLNDDELKKCIVTCGTIFDSKVYVVSIKTKKTNQSAGREVFSKDFGLMFWKIRSFL